MVEKIVNVCFEHVQILLHACMYHIYSSPVVIFIAICNTPCGINKECSYPETCSCKDGWEGANCLTGIIIYDYWNTIAFINTCNIKKRFCITNIFYSSCYCYYYFVINILLLIIIMMSSPSSMHMYTYMYTHMYLIEVCTALLLLLLLLCRYQ